MTKKKGKYFVQVEEGVMAFYQNRFWHKSSKGEWGSVVVAKVSNPEFCQRPTDMAERTAEIVELQKGKLLKVRKTTLVEFL